MKNQKKTTFYYFFVELHMHKKNLTLKILAFLLLKFKPEINNVDIYYIEFAFEIITNTI